MASNVGNVTVTVKIDDSLREEVIATLERAKRYSEQGREGGEGIAGFAVDAFALEVDALIAELKRKPEQYV